MSTILHPSPVFGPVHSRRLGVSLGINLMPADGKICTFDCIYCECGRNAERRSLSPRPTREQVSTCLEAKLQQMLTDGLTPDVLTFAGNGEPTAHPHFAEIIADTIRLRNRYCPNARISVLSNATMLRRKEVVDALMKIENNIQKLDTTDNDYITLVDQPQQRNYDVTEVIRQLTAFNGHVIIQTMFLQGQYEGKDVDNTTPQYVNPWLDALREIHPEQVMVYTIDRETPVSTLRKATREQLDGIARQVEQLGINCTVSY